MIAQRDEGTRRYTWLRRDDLEVRFPGLIDAVLKGRRHGLSGREIDTLVLGEHVRTHDLVAAPRGRGRVRGWTRPGRRCGG